MGNAERHKGIRGELEVCELLRKHGWPLAQRSSDGRSQGGRGDFENGPSGYLLDSKRQERLNIPQAFRRLQSDAGSGLVPLLVHRASRQPWLATMELEDVLPLIRSGNQGIRWYD